MGGFAVKVSAREASLEEARAINGVRAVFGEVYPDPVRVVAVGADVSALLADPSRADWARSSVEFCGGTHLSRTGEAQAFVILSEEGVAKGIRRITGERAAPCITALRRMYLTRRQPY